MNIAKRALLLSVVCVAGAVALADVSATKHPSREGDLVKKSATAIAIAKAVAAEAYGDKQVNAQLPFVASRYGDHWEVLGSLPKGIPGGVIEVHIAVADARVLQLQHGK